MYNSHSVFLTGVDETEIINMGEIRKIKNPLDLIIWIMIIVKKVISLKVKPLIPIYVIGHIHPGNAK